MTPTDRIRALRSHVERERGRRKAIEDAIEVERKRAEKNEREADLATKAAEVVQAAAEARRQELRDRVESLVTRGLRAVFGREDFEFSFRVTLARGSMGAVPVLRSKFGDEDLEVEIVDGHGGGVADVVSFLLRTVVLSLARPKLAPFLVLDEAFRHVSPEYLRGVAVLLRELADSAGIQFVVVTHKPELLDAADVIYSVSLEDERSVFRLEHDSRDESYHQRPKADQKRRDRSTAFDGGDLVERPPQDAEVVHHATTDPVALSTRMPRARVKRRLKRKETEG